jgi:hypothetical protein
MQQHTNDDDDSFPAVEKGDYVRLKEPYHVAPDMLHGGVRETVAALVSARYDSLDDDGTYSRAPALSAAARDKRYGDLFSFSHGTVVEVVSRYRPRGLPAAHPAAPHGLSNVDLPARNVSLHLFNPATGVLYAGGHPTEPGKPEYVDHHVAELVLVQKHDETWGEPLEVDIGERYAEFGIEDIGIGDDDP